MQFQILPPDDYSLSLFKAGIVDLQLCDWDSERFDVVSDQYEVGYVDVLAGLYPKFVFGLPVE